ncbi:5600_t:CDS:2, partial [Rhizophagus irregularis]
KNLFGDFLERTCMSEFRRNGIKTRMENSEDEKECGNKDDDEKRHNTL